MLEDGAASESEVEQMQTAGYSKTVFDLQFPVFVRQDSDYVRIRYYMKPVRIRGIDYMLSSQWYETSANNDRPYLMKWIREHNHDDRVAVSTVAGFVNENNQRNNGKTDKAGTGNNQTLFEMEYLNCGNKYYANGSDIWLRKCPACQGGRE